MRFSLHTLAVATAAAIPALGYAQLGLADLPCPAGGTGGTVYLSSIRGGACPDAETLQETIFALGETGTLVIDRTCTLNAGLRLPSRFTLRGIGMGSGGQLTFTHDGIAISMCQKPSAGHITIADLDLYGPNAPGAGTAPHSIGIAIANQSIVHLAHVRVSDFHVGVSGTRSYSVFIQGSNVSANRKDNIVVGHDSNAWRIRDGLVSQAGSWGINVLGPGDAVAVGNVNTSNDLLIDGVRMESNFRGAVRTDAYATRIVNSRFEGNGLGSVGLPHRAILVDTDAEEARILTNLLGRDCIQIKNASTQLAFNIPDQRNTQQCAEPSIAPR